MGKIEQPRREDEPRPRTGTAGLRACSGLRGSHCGCRIGHPRHTTWAYSWISPAIPHDCRDGFYGAFWRRPAAYLHSEVRAGISLFARLPQRAVTQALEQLRTDLASGLWQARHAQLLKQQEFDLGYYLIITEST